ASSTSPAKGSRSPTCAGWTARWKSLNRPTSPKTGRTPTTRRRTSVRALASPASFKGVLSASQAADALCGGLRAGGADASPLPVADGGEGTSETLFAALGGEWRGGGRPGPLGPCRAGGVGPLPRDPRGRGGGRGG